MHLNPDRPAAIRDAVQELIWPVTSSTITTVVVFLPLGLLTGVEGQFFHALSITLTIAVWVSLLLALSIIPLLSAQFITAADAEVRRGPDQQSKSAGGVLARVGRGIDTLSDRYERSLTALLHHARWMIVIAAALVLGGWLAHRYVGTGFLPEMDEGAFVLDYFTPGGTALSETDRELHIAENILAQTPEITGTSRRTGAELGLFATEQNTGDLAARLKPESERDRSTQDVIDDVRPKIEAAAPRLHIEFVQILSDVINDLAGAARPVEIKLFGPDLNALDAYAKQLAPSIEKIDGIEDLYDGVSEPAAELSMNINTAEAGRAGLTPLDVSGQVSGALLGADAGDVRLEDRSIGVRVRAPDSVRYDESQLGALPILSSDGRGSTPLAALASFQSGDTRAELLRENQQQLIDMTADISDRSLGSIMKDVKAAVAAHPAPAGIRLELAGQYASQ